MMCSGLGIPLFLFAAIGVPIQAGPISYTITFTGGPILPTAGSFQYDPASPQFTDFTVEWDGYTFDLTGSANSPYFGGGAESDPCLEGKTGAAASFLMLSQFPSTPCDGWGVAWSAAAYPGFSPRGFDFVASAAPSRTITVSYHQGGVAYGGADVGGGSWSIGQPGVPEPSTFIPIALAGVSLARKRIAQRLRRVIPKNRWLPPRR